jgi:dolichyl-phosphate beta-glucosyltransferase
MSQKIKYSIIVPAYQEAAVIKNSLSRIAVYLDDMGVLEDSEVIVVTATSSDGTANLVRSEQHRFKHFQLIEPGPRVGKGRDVRLGLLAAKGDYMLFTDADLATPERHIMAAFSLLEAGHDMVIGVRNLSRIHHGVRTVISLGTNLLTRIVILPSIPDTQCGFKGFRREAAGVMCEKMTILGWGFDMELLMIARKHRFKVAKLFIPDWHDPKIDMGLVGDSTWKAGIGTLKELWRIRRNAWKGLYSR